MQKMKKAWTLVMMLAAGLVVGCDQSDVEEATSAVESAAAETGEATGDLMDQAKEAGEKLKDEGAAALEEGRAKVDEAVEAGKQKVDEMVGGGEGAGASVMSLADVQAAESLDEGQAASVFGQVTQLIKDQNFDDAEKWIAALEKIGLPEGYGEKLVDLKDMLTNAQGLEGVGEVLKGIGG